MSDADVLRIQAINESPHAEKTMIEVLEAAGYLVVTKAAWQAVWEDGYDTGVAARNA